MATEDQYLNARRGVGSRLRSSMLVSLAMAAGATTKGQAALPLGSMISGIRLEKPANFTGTPTAINFRCGVTDGGQEVVADVDVKSQGHAAATIVAGFDVTGGVTAGAPAGVATPLYLQIVNSGGTNPVGTLNAIVDFDAPVS